MIPPAAPDPGWWSVPGGYAALGRRAWRYWGYKMFGITVGMTGFFWLYFQILNRPGFSVNEMPLLEIDRWIPFPPLWLVP